MKNEFKLMQFVIAGHQLAVIPNYYFKGFECDCFSINKNLYTTEYEIKISKTDFKNDFNKQQQRHNWQTKTIEITKHAAIKNGQRTNRFYFVVPKELDISVPDYAGLITFNEFDFSIVQQAPRLHKNKIDEREIKHCLTKLSWKYYHLAWDRNNQTVLNL